MEYTEKEKNEIRNDRKILDMILEKYGRDDVMQFLDTDFDDNDNGNYFDTFSQADNLEKYFYDDLSVTARKMYSSIKKHLDVNGDIKEKSTTEFVNRWNSFVSFIIDTYNNMKKTVIDKELLKSYAEPAYWMTVIWMECFMECEGYKDYPENIKRAVDFYLDGKRAEFPGYSMCYKNQEEFDNGNPEYDWEFVFLADYYENALELLRCMSKLYMHKKETAIDKFNDVNWEIDRGDAYDRFVNNAVSSLNNNSLNAALEYMTDQRLKNKISAFCTEVGELIK